MESCCFFYLFGHEFLSLWRILHRCSLIPAFFSKSRYEWNGIVRFEILEWLCVWLMQTLSYRKGQGRSKIIVMKWALKCWKWDYAYGHLETSAEQSLIYCNTEDRPFFDPPFSNLRFALLTNTFIPVQESLANVRPDKILLPVIRNLTSILWVWPVFFEFCRYFIASPVAFGFRLDSSASFFSGRKLVTTCSGQFHLFLSPAGFWRPSKKFYIC